MLSKVLLFLLIFSLASCATLKKKDPAPQKTDYETEVGLINGNVIHALHAYDRKPSKKAAFEIGYQYFTLASLTGSYESYKEAEFFLERSEVSTPDYYFSSAYFDYKLHRFRSAEKKLKSIEARSKDPHLLDRTKKLLADICLQLGRTKCDGAIVSTASNSRDWQDLSSEANKLYQQGSAAKADSLYEKALEILQKKGDQSYSTKRHLAWLELQRGLIDLSYERFDAALIHFQAANSIYSGYWLIEEHIAEALSRLNRIQEAVSIYKKVILSTNNPEYIAALATITSDKNERQSLEIQAQARFKEQLQLFPEAAAGHFLDFLLNIPEEKANALNLAIEDHERRPNSVIKLALAKAYLANSDCTKSLQTIDFILVGKKYRVPELFSTAEKAAITCGKPELAQRYRLEKQKLVTL